MNQSSPHVDSSSQAGSGRGEAQAREVARVELRSGQPRFEFIEREYEVRLARTPHELELAQRLRFEIFNRELGEGLRASEATGLDQDRFDSFCDHLLIIARDPALPDGVMTRDAPDTPLRVVGTYRLQALEVAENGNGLYCDQEFDLSRAPRRFLEQGIELGRACIAKEYRRGHALFALFRGLAHYLVESNRRYLYGCCSLTGTDPKMASQAREWLDRRGKRHPEFFVPARGAYAMEPVPVSEAEVEQFKLPQLFGTYLRYGALVCSEPAVDAEFGTIDFLVQFDLEAFDVRLRRLFLEG
jgi:putative hemolysin